MLPPPTRILVAVVSDSSTTTRTRTLTSMQYVEQTYASHQARLDWTITAYDDNTSAWQDVASVAKLMLRTVSLVSVINVTYASNLDPEQRRDRAVHRKRAVDAAWRLRGRDAWDAVWLADADMAFVGFDLAAFLLRRACALRGGPPLVMQPVIRQNTQCWPHNFATYAKHPNRTHSAAAELWSSMLMLRAAWVESQIPLIDANFLAWFYASPLVVKLLALQAEKYHVSWGTDAIWCGAAKDYATQHNLTREPCAIVTVPIDHVNTKSIGSKGAAYQTKGFRLLERAGIVQFRHHHCAPNEPPPKHGHGCPGKPHPWATFNLATKMCESKPPTLPSELVHVRRCAALDYDACDATTSVGRPDDSCRGMLPLYGAHSTAANGSATK